MSAIELVSVVLYNTFRLYFIKCVCLEMQTENCVSFVYVC